MIGGSDGGSAGGASDDDDDDDDDRRAASQYMLRKLHVSVSDPDSAATELRPKNPYPSIEWWTSPIQVFPDGTYSLFHGVVILWPCPSQGHPAIYLGALPPWRLAKEMLSY